MISSLLGLYRMEIAPESLNKHMLNFIELMFSFCGLQLVKFYLHLLSSVYNKSFLEVNTWAASHHSFSLDSVEILFKLLSFSIQAISTVATDMSKTLGFNYYVQYILYIGTYLSS